MLWRDETVTTPPPGPCLVRERSPQRPQTSLLAAVTAPAGSGVKPRSRCAGGPFWLSLQEVLTLVWGPQGVDMLTGEERG